MVDVLFIYFFKLSQANKDRKSEFRKIILSQQIKIMVNNSWTRGYKLDYRLVSEVYIAKMKV